MYNKLHPEIKCYEGDLSVYYSGITRLNLGVLMGSRVRLWVKPLWKMVKVLSLTAIVSPLHEPGQDVIPFPQILLKYFLALRHVKT